MITKDLRDHARDMLHLALKTLEKPEAEEVDVNCGQVMKVGIIEHGEGPVHYYPGGHELTLTVRIKLGLPKEDA